MCGSTGRTKRQQMETQDITGYGNEREPGQKGLMFVLTFPSIILGPLMSAILLETYTLSIWV